MFCCDLVARRIYASRFDSFGRPPNGRSKVTFVKGQGNKMPSVRSSAHVGANVFMGDSSTINNNTR